MSSISWKYFTKIDFRIGTITKVEDFPEARNPAFIVPVNFGEQIGPLRSQVLITGFEDENGNIVLASPERKIKGGIRIS